ncbi:MAG: prepilin-type N-terminal cleavage/methylation domain-containing protein [Chthoniobacteraceae bacterium]
MFISRPRSAAFTLLEIMLAVAILALIGIGIYRFVASTMAAVAVSTRADEEHTLVTAFADYLSAQMLALPPSQAGAVSGEAHRFSGVSSDELTWTARPGSALLTRHASGEWTVTLTAKALDHGEYELGVRRQNVARQREATWLPLLRQVKGFEVRYFDAGRKDWVEKWTDPQTRPALVKVRLWRGQEAFEWVLPIPAKAQPKGGGA